MNNTSNQRRAEMLALLQQAARDHSQWRRIRRRAVLLVPAIALLAGAELWWTSRDPAQDVNVVASAVKPAPDVAEIASNPWPPSVATDHRAAGILVDRIDDDQLLEMLSAIGRPAGLARINGRTELVAMENPPADKP